MRAAVVESWIRVNTPWEGRLNFLYADHINLVSIGIGNMVDASPRADPWRPVLALALRHPDGSLASQAEKVSAWEAVKARRDLTQKGGGAYKHVTTLRLLDADIDAMVYAKLASIGAQLEHRFAGFDDMPADGQFALASMSYAMGDARLAQFPEFCAFIRAGDYAGAATECLMQPNKGTLKDRNAADRVMLFNAAAVVADGLCRETLHYPRSVPVAVT